MRQERLHRAEQDAQARAEWEEERRSLQSAVRQAAEAAERLQQASPPRQPQLSSVQADDSFYDEDSPAKPAPMPASQACLAGRPQSPERTAGQTSASMDSLLVEELRRQHELDCAMLNSMGTQLAEAVEASRRAAAVAESQVAAALSQMQERQSAELPSVAAEVRAEVQLAIAEQISKPVGAAVSTQMDLTDQIAKALAPLASQVESAERRYSEQASSREAADAEARRSLEEQVQRMREQELVRLKEAEERALEVQRQREEAMKNQVADAVALVKAEAEVTIRACAEDAARARKELQAAEAERNRRHHDEEAIRREAEDAAAKQRLLDAQEARRKEQAERDRIEEQLRLIQEADARRREEDLKMRAEWAAERRELQWRAEHRELQLKQECKEMEWEVDWQAARQLEDTADVIGGRLGRSAGGKSRVRQALLEALAAAEEHPGPSPRRRNKEDRPGGHRRVRSASRGRNRGQAGADTQGAAKDLTDEVVSVLSGKVVTQAYREVLGLPEGNQLPSGGEPRADCRSMSESRPRSGKQRKGKMLSRCSSAHAMSQSRVSTRSGNTAVGVAATYGLASQRPSSAQMATEEEDDIIFSMADVNASSSTRKASSTEFGDNCRPQPSKSKVLGALLSREISYEHIAKHASRKSHERQGRPRTEA
eukprot:gnl/TRDRNA2_/TRDRNA2_166930_c4_seq2.p1 gnl/TRDRNA2_/TRDRNA2_166930_c4~~gnl/TRDRNA2_/TRDRNA2_166930_c4_seq2.p1  ORF type:complete len:657 (+),score=153.21 gnl/TRDRNA2_/TRDRNA2_166930_c4_seq2:57-2027(+)